MGTVRRASARCRIPALGVAVLILAWGHAGGATASTAGPASRSSAPTFAWTTVVNNGDYMPIEGCPKCRTFNSYNPPSINSAGLVVFRARSKGGGASGEPTQGVYTRDMSVPDSPIVRILDRTTEVPAPNDLDTVFTETPSFPRIGLASPTIVTRGNHTPVWLPVGGAEPAGTTGIYANPAGVLISAAANLGSVSGFGYFAVPGTAVSFEVFPGAPSVTGSNEIVFKGNYTDPQSGAAETGVFYRQILAGDEKSPVQPIADGSTPIPGTDVDFGSLAPPSAARRLVVFTGVDDENDPHAGGIYLAGLAPSPPLRTLVAIGSAVPGIEGGFFTQLGESLSFDGRYVAFWGAWGAQTKVVTLHCPSEGNAARTAYCLEQCPEPDGCSRIEPENQGIFVYDLRRGVVSPVARTGSDFDDFLFWNFTGQVPGVAGEENGEPARWRSSTYLAVSGTGNRAQAAFQAQRPGGTVGIYLGDGRGDDQAVIDTGADGRQVDPDAPPGSSVVAVGIERDGFRNRQLVVTASMAVPSTHSSEAVGWAGIYLTRVSSP